MSLQCILPLEKEFRVSIPVHCSMLLNDNININDPIDEFTLSINTSKLYLSKEQKEVVLDNPTTIKLECAENEEFTIDKVTVNEVSAKGSITFMGALNVLKNSDNLVADVPLAWPSGFGQVCIDDHLLIYADSIEDNYVLRVEAKNVSAGLDYSAEGLTVFFVKGILEVNAIKA